MASDSSSSEEEKDRFIQAVDSKFLPEDIYSKSEKAVKTEDQVSLSLRKQLGYKTEPINNPFTIKVTPEFQRYVSQHLSKILDKSIQDIEKKIKLSTKKEKLTGIKLLRNSKCFLQPLKSKTDSVISRRQGTKKNLSTKDLEQKAKEVAVSPEWILSQKETEYWASNNKGEVEILNCNTRKKSIEKNVIFLPC